MRREREVAEELMARGTGSNDRLTIVNKRGRVEIFDPSKERFDDGYAGDRAWTKNRLKRARARRINVAPAKSAG